MPGAAVKQFFGDRYRYAGAMPARGRPRSFDRAEALERAIRVFWERGYEGTSINDLTAAMGISSPSLYAAFGSKELLFRDAVERYEATEGLTTTDALSDGPTARASFETMLRRNVENYADAATPNGCMIVLAATVGAVENATVREFLAENRRGLLAMLADRVRRGIDDGDVDPGTDPEALAAFYCTVLQGLSIQARDGASLAALRSVVDGAMAAWDSVARTHSDTTDRS